MSKASAHIVSYIVEDTIGTTPTSPRFQTLPDSKTSLALTRDTLESTRMTPNRFPSAPRLGAKGVGGDIGSQLSYDAYDPFIASALQGTWVEDPGSGTDTVDMDVDGLATPGITEGQDFGSDNGTIYVETLNAKTQEVIFALHIAGVITTHPVYKLGTATIDGVVFEVTAYTDAQEVYDIQAGDTRTSFSILRNFSDFEAGKKPFLLFTGCEVATWVLTAPSNGAVESTFTLFGQGAEPPSLSAPTETSYKPAINSDFYDTFSGSVKVDGVKVCLLTDYTHTVENGYAPRYAVGCPESGDPSIGDSVLTGSFNAYFDDETFLEKFYNEEGLALELEFLDPDGRGIVINLPNLSILSGTQPDVTDDSDILIPVNFSAHLDEVLGSHISIRKTSPV